MDMIDTREAAAMVGFRPRTLEHWRLTGQGPTYVRVNGKAVRYRRESVLRWLSEQTVVTP